jgi:surface protein
MTVYTGTFKYSFDSTSVVDSSTIPTYLPISGNNISIISIDVTNTESDANTIANGVNVYESITTYTVSISYSYDSSEITTSDGVNFNVSTTVRDYYNSISNLKILDLANIPIYGLGSQFKDLIKLVSFNSGSGTPYISSNTSFDSMFYNCSNLTSVTFGEDFDVSNVTDMDYMFYGCSSLTSTEGIYDSWDISNVTSHTDFSTNSGIDNYPDENPNWNKDFDVTPPTKNITLGSTLSVIAKGYKVKCQWITSDTVTIVAVKGKVTKTFTFTITKIGTHQLEISDGYGKSQTVTVNVAAPLSNACFPAGTLIVTNQGIIPIDKINPEIHTIRNKQILAITKSVSMDKYLVKFEKDSLGKNIPSETTIMTQEHSVFYKGKMILAKDFVKHMENVKKIPYNGEIVYNILLEKYDKMVVNNLICNTMPTNNLLSILYIMLSHVNESEKHNLIEAYNNVVMKKYYKKDDRYKDVTVKRCSKKYKP